MTIADVQESTYNCGYYLTVDSKDYEFCGGDVAAPEFAECARCGRRELYGQDDECLTKLYGCADFPGGYLCDRCIKGAVGGGGGEH
jgi:hypothetical protein